MKLFFCDICNESIPLQDIKENRASTIKGKIFCQKCNPLNEVGGGSPTASGPSAKGGVSNLLLGLCALLLLALVIGGGYVVMQTQEQGLLAANRSGSGEWQARADALDQRIDELRAQLAKGSNASEVALAVGQLREDLTAKGGDIARVEGLVTKLQSTLQGIGDVRERVEKLSLRQEESMQKVASLTGLIESVKKDVTALGARPVEAPSDGAGARELPVEPTPVAPADPEVVALIEMLNSSAPLERWKAVDEARARKDKALIPHVLPLLDDRDPLVRLQAIYALGELRATAAVPKLVKLLRDDLVEVREEALTSLKVITGENMQFDVGGSRDERTKGVKKWEDWLAKNKDKL